jgi:hypothetical protein
MTFNCIEYNQIRNKEKACIEIIGDLTVLLEFCSNVIMNSVLCVSCMYYFIVYPIHLSFSSFFFCSKLGDRNTTSDEIQRTAYTEHRITH